MSFSKHANNKANNIYVMGKDYIQKINATTRDQSTKTSLYGNIYDFVVDYKAIAGTTTIYDMHRYLMTKHNIKS